ncbi:UvrB/UvrC motif-containing protein [Ruminiclostridium cellulolyticum]|uniref:UvrB/UvrC protein n=1 Tax=Ruminiclostridium cellulolyticum (strain ATCC 35319 / DSM 5812 / JCM 6584 / H10) TaxID=394503 RepID=B8I5P5_RUMCH|nr:UvrB/UvrC motif-containing protein [Ruminiclostridium cellulolyticum]ACL74712.1 UvrB/UvrC protein [Ruminiclostridium cellulolyticum H10]
MLCQNCQQRIASVHLTQIKNNTKLDIYLCEECAQEMSQQDFISPFGFNDLISGLFGAQLKHEPYVKLKCKNCGMEYNEFLKTSRLGCSQCYKVFADKLDPIVKRLHGNGEHHGKVPSRVSSNVSITNEMDKLKQLLNEAIKNEKYEEAAKIRDRIKSLEVEE